jgi:gamma-D-glutamyl-L-lysine dipeptidyl-peptidase
MQLYGICQLTLIPVRKEPAERSEMTNQLLFGETFDVLDANGSWSYICSHLDNYKGWITTKMLLPLTATDWQKNETLEKVFLKDTICRIFQPVTYLPVSYLAGGSTLTVENGVVMLGNTALLLESSAEIFHNMNKVTITETALKFLNSPYLWGGRTIFGIDCSGLTQIVYKMNGIVIPRDAHQQATIGNAVNSIDEALPGDLAFFVRDDGYIMHTGIILENQQIIHSTGKVRIDKIDEKGIVNLENKKYSHTLKCIKRIT